jgi:anaerobic ribonucleoside-triphosphate reductase
MTKNRIDATDLLLFVTVSEESVEKWNREKITNALLRETDIAQDAAEKISVEAEEIIKNSGVKYVTSALVREVVNGKLIEHGLEGIQKQHTRLGLPVYDVDEIIVQRNRENANIPHGPEATNLTLAEAIKKQYALLKVFTPDISMAHERGEFHLHDLGFIDRPYCSGNSIEYIKKFGLNLPNALSIAKPAKHPDVLLLHLIKFSAALQGTFNGAIGWDAVNLFLAPYLTGLDQKRMEQLAQIMIFEFAQQAVARGGQSIFSDLNIYWEIPKHFEGVPAVGPGGTPTGNNYEDYIEEAQGFATALFKVYLNGDAHGRPFFFPKPDVHITEKFFKTEGHEDFLHLLSETASEKGNPYFIFDRGETAKISECCRLAFKLDASDLEDAKQPWKMRYSAMQNLTLNLPRVAYLAKGDDDKLLEIINSRLEMMAKAHQQKKTFVEGLLKLGNTGPLGLLAMNLDGDPYYRLWRATFLFGMVGLNELVQYHSGEQLHESNDAFKLGLKIISFMEKESERLSEEKNMRFVLEQTPAESTAYRMAKLDLVHFPEAARKTVKGNLEKGEVYYTNSTYLNVGEPIDPVERVKKEGRFHPMIHAGAMSHVWLGEARPDPESIANFVKKTFSKTTNDQIAFSPEFTNCLDCGKTSRGLH